MINLKDNSYQLKTKDGDTLTFRLDFEAVLRLEQLFESSVAATRIFLDLFTPGSQSFFKNGLTILCACCVEKPNLTLAEFNQLLPLTDDTFTKVDKILHDLVTGYFGTSEESEAEKK